MYKMILTLSLLVWIAYIPKNKSRPNIAIAQQLLNDMNILFMSMTDSSM